MKTRVIFIISLVVFFLASPSMGDSRPTYVIIAPDRFEASADLLKEYRERTGYRVQIVLLSEISTDSNPDSNQIENWLDGLVLANPTIRYLCLLGDPAYLASIWIAENSLGEDIYSDVGYGVVGMENDSNYYRPEVLVGRIPIRTNLDTTEYLAKVEAFESTTAFRDAPVFWGWGAEIAIAVNSHAPLLEDMGYDPVVLVEPTEEEFFGHLNANPFRVPIVLYYSHGNSDSNPPLERTNLLDWNNASWPAIFFSGGCSVLQDTPVSEERSLGNAALFGVGGSVATIGDPTVGGGYGYGYSFVPETLGLLEDSHTLGQMFYNGLAGTIQRAELGGLDTSIGSWSYLFTKRFTLRGDPALQLNFTQAASARRRYDPGDPPGWSMD